MSNKREALLAELFTEIQREQELVQAFDTAAADGLGIHLTDLRCLGVLDRRGGLAATELAREAGLTTGATTALIDRLERAGYVERTRDAADRRRVLVQLTPDARRAIGRIWGPLAEDGLALASRYTDDQLELVVEYLRASRELLERHVDRVRKEAGG